MKLVIVESPYAGQVARNREYLNLCLRWCTLNGMSPYASHKMLTDSLDDNNARERKLGIKAGILWYSVADTVLFFTDFGWSKGMRAALDICLETNMKFEVIQLKETPDAAAEFHNLVSRLSRDPEQGAGVSAGDQGQVSDTERGVQSSDETLRSEAGSTEGE